MDYFIGRFKDFFINFSAILAEYVIGDDVRNPKSKGKQ